MGERDQIFQDGLVVMKGMHGTELASESEDYLTVESFKMKNVMQALHSLIKMYTNNLLTHKGSTYFTESTITIAGFIPSSSRLFVSSCGRT